MSLDLPAEVVGGDAALDRWLAWRAEGDGWPVILGDEESVARMMELADDAAAPHQVVSAAAGLVVEGLVEQWRADNELDEDDDDDDEIVGEWPEDVGPTTGLVVPFDLSTGEPLPRVVVARLPVDEGWKSAAALAWGGWNACPPPHEHVAIHRWWSERFGAEVVCMTDDTLEMRVGRPPATRDEAMALAEVHYAYCPDVVEQGTETVSALAATLLDAPYWYFWWD